MGSMFFGQYLLSRGAINREALIDAIERQPPTFLWSSWRFVTAALASKPADSGSGPNRRSRPRVMNRPVMCSPPSVRVSWPGIPKPT